MDARLAPQRPERAVAVDLQARAFEPAEPAVLLRVHDRDIPSPPLGESRVHVEQVAGEDAALGPADAHRHLHERVEPIVRVRRQELSTKGSAYLIERSRRLLDVGRRHRAHVFVRVVR